jgi:putative transposase
LSKRYTHTPSQRHAAGAFLRQSEILADPDFLERCESLMQSTVIEAGMMVVSAILEISAARLTGAVHQGKAGGEFVRHGRQPGAVYLGGSKVRVDRPRVRSKSGKEAKIPAYEALSSDKRAGEKVMRATVAGVSVRNYGKAIEDASEVAGISKSSVSRRVIDKTTASLQGLMERAVPKDTIAVMIDGIRMGPHMILGAVGIDSSGKKQVLGLADGTTENARVVSDLLLGLKERGLDTGPKILFVVDGSKAIRAAIKDVCGAHHEIQRCREHKIRNVTDRISKARVKYVRSFMRAAWKLSEPEGTAKMKQLAKELEVSYPDAARSVMEGLEETFTITRLQLPPMLIASLQSTNIIENANGTIRSITSRVKNFSSADQALRWAATALTHAETGFRKLRGHSQLWMLEAALERTALERTAQEKAV